MYEGSVTFQTSCKAIGGDGEKQWVPVFLQLRTQIIEITKQMIDVMGVPAMPDEALGTFRADGSSTGHSLG